MARRAHGQAPVAVTLPQLRHGRRAEPAAPSSEENLVEVFENVARLGVSHGGASHRVASQGGDEGAPHPLAAYVTDPDRPVPVGDLEHVVEVATDLVARSCGAVDGRDVEIRD